MHWILLTLSILAEVVGTLCLKWSQGFARLWPTVGMIVLYIATFVFLTLAAKTLDLGLAYAIWAGVSVAGVAACGVILFQEPMNAYRVIGIMAIIVGVLVLNLKAGVQ
ncbi:MAG TPA: multidrug efflux SMR transporter [Verrucomicrobiae bacterium]|nr:multidrug efflux SMR transporter [Verrucomicrobiae bacterium]